MKTQPDCLLIYGNTCSGKSTLGQNLAHLFKANYISFGDLKRKEMVLETPAGIEMAKCSQFGIPFNPHTGMTIIEKNLQKSKLNILSGFPISEMEIKELNTSASILGVILLEIDAKTSKQRFYSRGICPYCNKTGKKGYLCLSHKTELTERPDCNEQVFLSRQKLYSNRISPFVMGIKQEFPFLSLNTSFWDRNSTNEIVTNWLQNLLGGRCYEEYNSNKASP